MKNVLFCLVVVAAVAASAANVNSGRKESGRPAKVALQEKSPKSGARTARKAPSSAKNTPKSTNGKAVQKASMNKIEDRMNKMKLRKISFKPPATIVDAMEFFRIASQDYDDSNLPIDKRGFNFLLQAIPDGDGVFPIIPAVSAESISFPDALKLVLSSVGYKFAVQGSTVVVMPEFVESKPYIPRSYAKGPGRESQAEKRLRLEAYEIEKCMKKTFLPRIAFKTPATIFEAKEYFASIMPADPKPPMVQHGFAIDLKATMDENGNPSVIPFLAADNISYWDALCLVCQGTGFEFEIIGSTILLTNFGQQTIVK